MPPVVAAPLTLARSGAYRNRAKAVVLPAAFEEASVAPDCHALAIFCQIDLPRLFTDASSAAWAWLR